MLSEDREAAIALAKELLDQGMKYYNVVKTIQETLELKLLVARDIVHAAKVDQKR